MSQIFGDYREHKDQKQEYLKIGFSPSSRPLQERWRNNGLSADFLADYLSSFFPGDDSEALERQTEIKGAVSFIANELLENAMKFNYFSARCPVSITMQLEKNSVCFYVQNSVDPQRLAAFQAFIDQLLTNDTDALYMERVLMNAEREDEASGLGFLTMINDYHAKVAWRFDPVPDDPAIMMVTTMVYLPI